MGCGRAQYITVLSYRGNVALLVANLHSPFWSHTCTYTAETKSPVECRETQPFFESVPISTL